MEGCSLQRGLASKYPWPTLLMRPTAAAKESSSVAALAAYTAVPAVMPMPGSVGSAEKRMASGSPAAEPGRACPCAPSA